MPTFTAMFNDRSDAEQARSELGQLGLSTGDISIHDQNSAGMSGGEQDRNEGGFFDGLRDLFVPDEDSQTYGEGLRRGHTLLTVQASDAQADQVHQLLESSRAVDVDESASSWRNEGWTGPSASSGNDRGSSMRQGFEGSTNTSTDRTEEVVPVIEEQLAVGKREVNRGGVRVRSYAREIPVHEQVSLREEHVEVERRPVDQKLQAGELGDAFQERTIEMTETGEEAVVAKNARVVEEVVVRKDVNERVEQIDDTVRRTDVDVEQLATTDRQTSIDGKTGTDRQSSTDRGALFGNDGTDRTDRR